MSQRRRSPRPVTGALEQLRGAWEPESPLGRAQTAWEDVRYAWAEAIGEHGAYVVQRTELVSLRAGVLTVRCSEAVVAETLTLESAAVLERLNARLQGVPITRLRCVTAG
ncbi:MAG: DciA family protein [Solirubrobacteraceae bacterium]